METKTIRKFSIGMMLLMLVLVVSAVFGLPQTIFAAQVSAYKNNVGETLKISSIENYEIEGTGDTRYVTLPTATFEGGVLNIKAVTNNATQKVALNKTTSTSPETPQLTLVNEVSSYVVTYTLTSDNGVETVSVVNVELDLTQPVFEWAINEQNIIPATVNRKIGENYTTIVLPNPTITDGNGTELTTGTLTATISDPEQTKTALSKNTEGYFYWTAAEDSIYGIYTITYTYKSDTAFTKTQSFTFNLSEEPVDVELLIDGWKDVSGTATLPTSMALAVESALPAPVVVNTKASSANVDVYTLIYLECTPSDTAVDSVTYTNDETKEGDEYVFVESLNEFKFTPTIAGKYTLKYVVKDFFGNETDTSSSINSIEVKKSKTSGTAFIVEEYNETDVAGLIEDMENGCVQTAEYMIPSLVGKGFSEFSFPAIFGYDKAYADTSTAYSFDSTNLTYQIKITYTAPGATNPTTMLFSSSYTNDNKLNPRNPSENQKLNDFSFDEAVEYKIEYIVRDKENNSIFDKTFEVNVEETYPGSNLSISTKGIGSVVKYGSTVKFKVNATDYRADNASTMADSRLKVEVKYSVSGETYTAKLYDDGYYAIEVKDGSFVAADQMIINAKVTNDYGFTKEITPKIVKIVNVSTDQSAPEVTQEFSFASNWYDDDAYEFRINNTKYGLNLTNSKVFAYNNYDFNLSGVKYTINFETNKVLKSGVEVATVEDSKFTIDEVEYTINAYRTKLTYDETKEIALKTTKATEVATITASKFTINEVEYTIDIADSKLIYATGEIGLTVPLKTFETGTELRLPYLTFEDTNSNMTATITIACNGKVFVGGEFSKPSGDNKTLSIGGQSFVLSLDGSYFVTYKAVDLAGNTTTKCFIFEVKGETIPIIHTGDFKSTYEFGDSIDISDVTVTVNSVETSYVNNLFTNIPTTNDSIVAFIESMLEHLDYYDAETGQTYKQTDYDFSNGAVLCLIEGNTSIAQDSEEIGLFIVAGRSGTITLSYWAISENGDYTANPVVVSFDTQDTTAPVINLSAEEPTTHPYEKDFTEEQKRIYIPDASAIDPISKEACEVTITAKYTSSETGDLTIKEDESRAGYYGYVTATRDGYIEVTYQAKDAVGNDAETYSFKIAVGDVTPPEIVITDLQTAIDNANYGINSTVSLNLKDKVKISDNKDTLDYTDLEYKVTRDGNDITSTSTLSADGILTFTANAYGEYKVTFNVEDSAGMEATTKDVSFKVSNQSGSSTVSTTVWGTILIIAVLVALGVIIFFFAKPTKSKSKSKVSVKKEQDKEENTKIEV